VCDLSAGLLSEVFHDVGIEPVLQPLKSGEEFTGASTVHSEEARLTLRPEVFGNIEERDPYFMLGCLTHTLPQT
jgi:hypothetical protein